MQVNILGTEYEIIKGSVLNCPSLKELDGFTDYTVKQIVVLDFGTVEKDNRSLKNFEQWARNEEMVDWFAIQWPKLSKAFKEAGCE